MVGESRGLALLDGDAGRFLVQEGRGDKALPLVRSDNSEAAHQRQAMAGEVAAGA
jgi:hypothetical protein